MPSSVELSHVFVLECSFSFFRNLHTYSHSDQSHVDEVLLFPNLSPEVVDIVSLMVPILNKSEIES